MKQGVPEQGGDRDERPEREAAPDLAPDRATAATARAATVGRLAEELAKLTAAGDIAGARAIVRVIGELLDVQAGEGPDTTGRGGGAVVDLEAERKRRAGR